MNARACKLMNPRRTQAPAYTLIELVLSTAALTVLMGAVGSAIVITTHALPDGRSDAENLTESYFAAAQIADDLRTAISFTEKTATAITFSVPDRDNDSNPETIRYAWAGSPGNPLTRQYNGGTVATLAANVRDFNLAYDLTAVSVQNQSPGNVEGSEELFIQQDTGNSTGTSQFALGTGTACAQSFQPVLPLDAVSWRVTRVKFKPSPAGGTSGVLAVGLHPVLGNGNPDNTPLDMVQVLESDMVANNWYEVSFANAGGLDPTARYAIHFSKQSGGGSAGTIEVGTGSLFTPNTTYYFDDGGGTWFADTSSDLRIWVWGTVTTPDAGAPPSSRSFLEAVTVSLRIADDTATPVQTSVQILNTPEVTGL